MKNQDEDRTRRYLSDRERERERGGQRERGERGGGERGGNRRQGEREREREYDRGERGFGLVLAVKESFGFVLPYQGEEHVFFSFRDGLSDPVVGEEVEYYYRQGPKGPAATFIRRVDQGKITLAPPPSPSLSLPPSTTRTSDEILNKTSQERYHGLISWDPDQYKNTPGVITLTTPLTDQNNQIPTTISFLFNDIMKTASNRRVGKGDEVEFDLYIIPGTQYARAKDVSMFRSKRDRQIAEQIQLFTKAGVLPEHGVIDSIKSDYGFIKSCDRPDQLFFRLDDIIDETIRPNENDEVAFYVISEHSRGKMSDRAVHISFLPHDTVFFEKLITSDVVAYVCSEPKASTSSKQEEQPGMLRLATPIEYDQELLIGAPSKGDIKTITHVELWGRCMPDFLASTMRIGDMLRIDVSLYRPEKLIFARNVRIAKYRSLGRMYGVVSEVKEGRGYGFIKCLYGGLDTYFRTNEVLRSIQENGAPSSSGNQFLDERSVKISLPVSYECNLEEVSSGESKLRASRLVAEPTTFDRKTLLIANIKGTVIKEPKKDATGILSLNEGQNRDGKPITLPTHQEELRFGYDEIYKGIEEIAINPDIKDILLDYVLPRQRFAIHELIRTNFPGIAHQTLVDPKASSASLNGNGNGNSNNQTGKGQKVRIWKIDDPDDFSKWSEEERLRNSHGNKSTLEEKKGDLDEIDVEIDGEELEHHQRNTRTVPNRIHFLKSDLCDSTGASIFGGVRAGAVVDFDLCIDKLNCSKVASNVRVSDELVGDGMWPQLGVVEFMRVSEGSSSTASGYIRSIPDDEKLPWVALAPLSIGTQVCFELRNRGGVRYANLVTPLNANPNSLAGRTLCAPCSETILSGKCTGVVVNELVDGVQTLSVYPFDFFECQEFSKKILDIPEAIVRVIEKKREPKGSHHSDEGVWEKRKPDEIEDSKPSSTTQVESKKLSSYGVPVYYPPISPYVIPLVASIDSSIFSPGMIIEFQPIVNWSIKRGPIGIHSPSISSRIVSLSDLSSTISSDSTPLSALLSKSLDGDSISQSGRQRGTIIRLTINAGSGVELAEVSRRDGALFYCESKELRRIAMTSTTSSTGGSGSVTVHVGDEIEFIPVAYSLSSSRLHYSTNEIHIAAQPTLIRTGTKKKVSASKTPEGPKPTFKTPITMAAGPPADSDRGFPVGWRGESFKQSLSSIPWLSSLLPHLLEEGVC